MDAKDFQKELNKPERSNIEPQVKDKIKEFLGYLQSREDLSYDRLYFYADKLRMISWTIYFFANPRRKY